MHEVADALVEGGDIACANRPRPVLLLPHLTETAGIDQQRIDMATIFELQSCVAHRCNGGGRPNV